ncbi:MAG: hypothetical protein IRZ33_07655, partial [Alicyclobacillaceae bacterium]|nr:hypothetical protein [Alicyclobacillaceae bacterium]
MRLEYLTPHQFERLQPFIDTLAVAACHPDPLDVAVPTGAARWISEMVLARVKDRFRGRVAERLLGTGLTWRGLDAEFLQALSAGCGFPVRFGVVVCDRALLSDCCAITAGPSEWLVVDWWQWFRSRAPRERLPDLWLYLSLAHAPYRHSEEW